MLLTPTQMMGTFPTCPVGAYIHQFSSFIQLPCGIPDPADQHASEGHSGDQTMASASRSQQARVCLARQVACRLSLDNATCMYTWTRGIRDSFDDLWRLLLYPLATCDIITTSLLTRLRFTGRATKPFPLHPLRILLQRTNAAPL
jgi:hypothetical protein